MMLNGLQELKEQEGAHYTEMCDVTGLAYSSVNRWRGRSDKGLEPIMAPGPKKVEPLDIEGLENRIMHLHHRRKRSYGTGDLFMEFASQMSRRGLSAMVTEARTEKNRQLRESQYRIRWLCPGLVWSMDDTEQKHEGLGEKVSIHSTRDLSSKYMFDPLLDLDLAKGPEIAENLNTLFKKHEPPLFMKRDWGKNLNHRDVNAVLSENMVIPVNSPAYYPQYNGGIEKGQYEIKSAVDFSECKDLRESTLAVRLGAHDLNHRRRRILSWQTPCQTLSGPGNVVRTFNKRKRKEVYHILTAASAAIMELTEGKCTVDKAWRLAVETWLLEHGFISMSRKRECYPVLCKLIAHH